MAGLAVVEVLGRSFGLLVRGCILALCCVRVRSLILVVVPMAGDGSSYLFEKISDNGNAAEAAFEATLPVFAAILAGILTMVLAVVLTSVLAGVLAIILTFILPGVLTMVLIFILTSVLVIVLTEAAALVHAILTASVCVLGSVNIPTLRRLLFEIYTVPKSLPMIGKPLIPSLPTSLRRERRSPTSGSPSVRPWC